MGGGGGVGFSTGMENSTIFLNPSLANLFFLRMRHNQHVKTAPLYLVFFQENIFKTCFIIEFFSYIFHRVCFTNSGIIIKLVFLKLRNILFFSLKYFSPPLILTLKGLCTKKIYNHRLKIEEFFFVKYLDSQNCLADEKSIL